jgi:hypothetical protein
MGGTSATSVDRHRARIATGRLDARCRASSCTRRVRACPRHHVRLALAGFAALLERPRALSVGCRAGIFCSIMIAASVGTMLPLLFSRIGVDPAVASGPLVTTATDVMGFSRSR